MKKKGLLSALMVIGLSVFLASCFSMGKVVETTFDPSIPESSSAKVLFWLDVQTYNGIDIRKAWAEKNNDIALVSLPSGESAFTFNAYFTRDYGRLIESYTINDCEFRYKFESGQEYIVRWFLEKEPKKFLQPQEYKYYVQIYNKLPGNMRSYNSSDFKDSDLLASFHIFDTLDFKK